MSRVDTRGVSVQFQKNGGATWWLTSVYGPQSNDDKLLFLQELRQIRDFCQSPWAIVGDFNLIYTEEDKNNSSLNRSMMDGSRSL
jgi:exonuclease III